MLLIHKKSGLKRPDELWKRDKIEETLISFPRTDPVHACFQRGVERLGVDCWSCGIEATSERFIEHYVASGYGIGLAVAVPVATARSSVAALPAGCCRCGMVRQAFGNSASTTRGIGRRSRDATGANSKGNSRIKANSFRQPRR